MLSFPKHLRIERFFLKVNTFFVSVLLLLTSTMFGDTGFGFKRTQGICCVFLKKSELISDNKSRNPLSVDVVSKNLGRYDAIWSSWLLSKYNYPSWKFLRENRPDQLVLYAISADTTRDTKESSFFDYNFIAGSAGKN